MKYRLPVWIPRSNEGYIEERSPLETPSVGSLLEHPTKEGRSLHRLGELRPPGIENGVDEAIKGGYLRKRLSGIYEVTPNEYYSQAAALLIPLIAAGIWSIYLLAAKGS